MFSLSERSIEQVEDAVPPHRNYFRRRDRSVQVDMPEQLPYSGIGPAAIVETEQGPRHAKDIVAGDRVLTREHGFAPVLWAGCKRRLYGGTNLAPPMRVASGALDALGKPHHAAAFILAAGQRILLCDEKYGLYFGVPDVLCQAGDLGHVCGVSPVTQRYAVAWVHLLFDASVLMQVNGLWLESLAPDLRKLRQEDPSLAREIEVARPALRFDHGQASYVPRQLVLNAEEARLIGL